MALVTSINRISVDRWQPRQVLRRVPDGSETVDGAGILYRTDLESLDGAGDLQ